MFRNAFSISMLFMLISIASPYAKAADSCQPLANAAAKLVTTPTHIYATTLNAPANKPTIIEMIYAKGAVYGKVGGNSKNLHICQCALNMPTFRHQGFDHGHTLHQCLERKSAIKFCISDRRNHAS